MKPEIMNTLPDTYSAEEKAELERQFQTLLRCWKGRKDEEDVAKVTEAYMLAANAHKDARRKSGEPYMYHPLAVATIIAGEMGMGMTSIICALLHDVVEDTEYTLDDMRRMFGDKVAQIVDGVTKLTDDEVGENVKSLQAETFRKVIMSMSDEIRIILVKLADRLHNMRTLGSMPHHKQLKIASETTQIYAPMAYRLGLYKVKTELDDLCLKYINPQIFNSIKAQLAGIRERKLKELKDFVEPVKDYLKKRGINVTAMAIERNVSAVWERMAKFGMSIDEVYDVYVVRIIIDCEREEEKMRCWETFAAFTSFYYPDSKKMRDWVSFPKTNGYESIHAVFMSKEGNWVETQIRTERMNEIAEHGFSAYWKFRDPDTKEESGLDLWMSVVKNLVRHEDTSKNSALEFIDNFKLDLFNDEIFVFTPKGDKMTFPKGATVLDFAYAVHSEIGNHCVGANVNKKIASLNTELKMGDQIEIITSQHVEPQEEWFDYISTSTAKSRLKEGIKDYRKTFKTKGKPMLEEMFRKAKVEFSVANKNLLVEKLHLMGRTDLYYYVAIGKVGQHDVDNVFRNNDSKVDAWLKYITFGLVKSSPQKKNVEGINAKNPADKGYVVAQCCKPIPGDDVVAIKLPGEPAHIHRPDCPEAMKLMSRFGKNIVVASWKLGDDFAYLATLKLTCINKIGLGVNIFDIISKDEKLDIREINMKSEGAFVIAKITLMVTNVQTLNNLIEKLKKIELIKKVERIVENK
ncbi:MAG: RelA/SpoT family protein [Bacteroidia bacterium]|nr:RelA/SpoT family protein [Bacteroidia bacterium]